MPLHIRIENYIKYKERIEETLSLPDKQIFKNIIEQVIFLHNSKININSDYFNNFFKKTEHININTYTIDGRLDFISKWFEDNIITFDKIRKLKNLETILEKFMPYSTIIDNYCNGG